MGMVVCCESKREKQPENADEKLKNNQFIFPTDFGDEETITYFAKNWELKEGMLNKSDEGVIHLLLNPNNRGGNGKLSRARKRSRRLS